MTRLEQFLIDRGVNVKSVAMGGAAVALLACGATAGTLFGDEVKSAFLDAGIETTVPPIPDHVSEHLVGTPKIKPIEHAMISISDTIENAARQMKNANCLGVVRTLEGELDTMMEVASDEASSPIDKFNSISNRLSAKFGIPITMGISKTNQGFSVDLGTENKPNLTPESVFLAMQAAGCTKQLETTIADFTETLQDTAKQLGFDENGPTPRPKPI